MHNADAIAKLEQAVVLLREMDRFRDDARNIWVEYSGHFGSPISRLLNTGLQTEAIIILIQEELERLRAEEGSA